LIHNAIALLPSENRPFADEIISSYPQARSALELTHHPVIITVHHVPVSALRNESGAEPTGRVKELEQYVSLNPVLLQLFRFELAEPVAPEHLQVELVSPEELS
jgi:hypothetical protein